MTDDIIAIREAARREVENAPPLTAEQRANLRALLSQAVDEVQRRG